MANTTITKGEAFELIAKQDPTGDYELIVGSDGGRVKLGRNPRDALQNGRTILPNQPVRVTKHEVGEQIYGYAVGKDTPIEIAKTQFSIIREATAIIDSIATGFDETDNTTAPPRSDNYVWRHDSGVDLNAATVEEVIEAPNRADFTTIHVDGAEGAYHVEMQFTDANGNVVTQRDDGDDSNYAGSSTSDVYLRVATASPHLTVRLVDDSGVANTVDYNIYAR